MDFHGIKIRFDCKNNEQYRAIGDFWSYMKAGYPNYSLKGVGYNWHNDSFDYVIGDFVTLDFEMDKIKKHYLTADYVKITLPDNGWQTFNGKTENLSKLYAEIYEQGALLYEIEEFYSNGNCKISIFRQ